MFVYFFATLSFMFFFIAARQKPSTATNNVVNLTVLTEICCAFKLFIVNVNRV